VGGLHIAACVENTASGGLTHKIDHQLAVPT
jgi:hypothetical protein